MGDDPMAAFARIEAGQTKLTADDLVGKIEGLNRKLTAIRDDTGVNRGAVGGLTQRKCTIKSTSHPPQARCSGGTSLPSPAWAALSRRMRRATTSREQNSISGPLPPIVDTAPPAFPKSAGVMDSRRTPPGAWGKRKKG